MSLRVPLFVPADPVRVASNFPHGIFVVLLISALESAQQVRQFAMVHPGKVEGTLFTFGSHRHARKFCPFLRADGLRGTGSLSSPFYFRFLSSHGLWSWFGDARRLCWGIRRCGARQKCKH